LLFNVVLSSLELLVIGYNTTFEKLLYSKFIGLLSLLIKNWFGRLFYTTTIGTLDNIYKLKKSTLNKSLFSTFLSSLKLSFINFYIITSTFSCYSFENSNWLFDNDSIN